MCLMSACGEKELSYSDQASKVEEQDDENKPEVVVQPQDPQAPVVTEPVVVDVPVVPGPMLPYPPIFGGGGGGRGNLCGNGRVERQEECDDGNRQDGDGCSSRCRFEGDTTLSLVKVVVNDDEGDAVPADFELIVTGQDGLHDDGIEYSSGDDVALQAGVAYTVSENPLAGYTQTGVECLFGLTNVGNPFVAVADQPVTCTVTNNDNEAGVAPTVTLIKSVINDDEGDAVPADFVLTLNNAAQLQNVAIQLTAGVQYTVSEQAFAGYTQTGIACVDGLVPVANPFVPQAGQNIVCTVTNDDNGLLTPPILAVTKAITGVINLPDLSIFSINLNSIGGNELISFPVSGDINTQLTAGVTYTISEPLIPEGYAFGNIVCTSSVTGPILGTSFTPVSGELINCVVTNELSLPLGATLNLVKQVNDVGAGLGPIPVSGFELTVAAGVLPPTIYASGASVQLDIGTIYTVSENLQVDDDYENVGISCVDGLTSLPVTNPIEPLPGQIINCTIVNIYDPPGSL